MRFMMLVRATADSEAEIYGENARDEFAAMGEYNESLVKAGVLLAAEGLQPSSRGARIQFSGGKRTVVDGPFTEAKELIAGFWIIDVKSREEAMEWASRVPFVDGEVEIRPVFEASDFPAEVFPPEAAAREQAIRDELQAKTSKP
jgi:hypothetical protein